MLYDVHFYHWPETNGHLPTNITSSSGRVEERQFEPLYFAQFTVAESIAFTTEMDVLEHHEANGPSIRRGFKCMSSVP